MLLPSHLRRSRHGIYYFRIVLPDPIALVLGQRELVRSLGIRSPKLARQSGYQLSLRIMPILERLQRIMVIDPNSISLQDIKKLVVEGMVFQPDGGMRVERVKTSDDPVIAKQEMKALEDTATAWRRVHNFTANLSDEDFAKRKADAVRLRDEMLAMASPQPPAASAPTPLAALVFSIPLRPSTLRQCFDAYIASKKKIAKSTNTAYTGSFELFAKLSGGEDRMAHEITEVEFMEFNDALAFVPSHATKRGIQLKRSAEMIESPPVGKDKAGNPVEYDAISGNTANLHITNLQGFFDYVIKSGRRNGDNPFIKLPRHSDGEEVGGADGFDEHELRAIFKPESLMQAKRPSQFWTPLLALYTGARLNELACLELTDFVQEKGISCISIRYVPRAKPGTIEHNQKKKSARSVKTASSIRLVPLHPDLYEIGIEAYMEDVRAIGATRFFPTLPPDTKGKRERRLSHDGNTYLKKVEVHVPRKKVMHSFRDTVCEMLAVPDMDDVRADQWTGHAATTVKGRHYRRSKAAIELQAKEGFGALNFPFIDLEAIQYQPGWFDAYNKENMAP
jgi:hypothetical protein